VLEIIYQDEFIVAINKPHGMLVHRSRIAEDVTESCVQLLEEQLGRKVWLAHRLDRKTSGVLLFSLDESTNVALNGLFMKQLVEKTYYALVRGYAPETGVIDYPLKRDDGKVQEAITHFKTLDKREIPVPFGKFSTSRYSFLEISPKTGRMHQIRKHLAHIFHPIIGDRPHGCNKQNRLFKEKWEMDTMLLHAGEIAFEHPQTKKNLVLKASFSEEFLRMMKVMGFGSL
jgi:tRNA pseudouridine65 synthase